MSFLWNAGGGGGGGESPDSGLLRYAFEDDSDTTTTTDSWNDNDGSTVGDPQYSTTSKYGTYGLLTDGSGDSVDTGIASLSTPFSIAVWINPQTVETEDRFWGNFVNTSSDLYLWEGNGANAWEILDDAGSALAGPSITTGSYVLVTYARGDSESHLYVNDIEEDSATGLSAATYDSGETFKIAERGDGDATSHSNAIFDNFDIYTKMLSSSEVSNLYSTGSIDG